ncbi:MAG: glycoside hydrolase family 13 protein [Bacilli bacterium]|nr:glycoside hydrolase family 13 protein [Bacilli bacterium]
MQGNLENINFNIRELEKTPTGAKFKISIQVPMSMGFIERMKFIVESTNERRAFQLKHLKNENDMVYFETEIELPTKALYHYYFSFEANHNFIYFKKENKTDNQTITPEEKWNMSVNFDVPEWAKGGVMYHIFVDRFNNSRNSQLIELPNRTIHKSWDEDPLVGPDKNGLWNADFYGGTLKGIEDKLDYIKSLGVNIIYLSPVVMSQSNHRYDAADYRHVDPYAGTNKDLKSLCDKAHKLGMKVVLDAVFNHTGNDSIYFNEFGNYPEKGAFEGPDSKYYNFYRKHFANATTYFDYWWGMTNLPVCDGNSKEWQQYIYGENGVIDLWFSLGIDGLRLDVADELTDEFIEGIRTAVKRNKEDGFILGEVWKNPMRMGRGYIESGKGMDSVMDYVLVDALLRYFKYGDVTSIAEVIRQLRTEYPEGTLQTLMNFTSTHDISRAINLFGCDEFKRFNSWAWDLYNENRDYQKYYHLSPEQYEYGKQLYKSYIYFLTFFPGILSIFYGDEVGLQGLGNLANRRPFPWGKEDKDLLSFFRYMGSIRKKEQFLRTADVNVYDINDRFILFERQAENLDALIAINRTGEPIPTPIPEKYYNIDTIYPLGSSDTRSIDSHGGLVLKKVKK